MAEETRGADEAAEETGTIIRDTDIVFDCPHCGHNLAIDYRGAGLRINCVNCGREVLVPIPDGMKIDDLDLENGEVLKQLFATRRNLKNAELRNDLLQNDLVDMTANRDKLATELTALKQRIDEMRALCQQQAGLANKLTLMFEAFISDTLPVAGEAAGGTEETSAS